MMMRLIAALLFPVLSVFACDAGWTSVSGQCRIVLTATVVTAITLPTDWSSTNTIELVSQGGIGGAGSGGGSGGAGGGGGAGGNYGVWTNNTGLSGTYYYAAGAGSTIGVTSFCQDSLCTSAYQCQHGAEASGTTGGTNSGTTCALGPGTPFLNGTLTNNNGGNGGNGGSGIAGGGGGGAGGPNGAGGNASGSTGGTADNGTVASCSTGSEWGTGNGSGGGCNGAATSGNGTTGANYGGGGGGGRANGHTGGNGGNGLVIITYTPSGPVGYADVSTGQDLPRGYYEKRVVSYFQGLFARWDQRTARQRVKEALAKWKTQVLCVIVNDREMAMA
ncbi:MAG TPA: hypothetical protein VJQ59_16655 [Candidatus Sulfotelmatobacter sp.]|nr:hypothetical protein [Candidatus Sulfotelmatobacter sp.]